MKRFFVTLVLLCGISALASCSSSNTKSEDTSDKGATKTVSATSEEGTFTTYENALQKAHSQNKIIMLDVYTNWCVWCKRMDKDVYSDPKVKAELDKYFAPVKLNAEAPDVHTFRGQAQSEQNFAAQLGIEAYPTIVFMSADEKPIKVLPGYVPAAEFTLALRYIGSGAYQTTDFDSWKKTQG